MSTNKRYYLGPYITTSNKMDYWAVSEAINEKLFCPQNCGELIVQDKHIWIPNRKFIERRTHLEDVDGVLSLLDLTLSAKECDLLKKTFEKELEIVQRMYGEYTIGWGVVIYCM